ncbi:hypothetical protein GW17_00043180 [Ensete ventricosum]|nr:hypothetical protein GW17_00043180 [Ensete ventricosum]
MYDSAMRRWRPPCPRAATPAVGAIALGRHLATRQASCLQAMPLLSGLAIADNPCRGPGYGKPPPFLAAFTAKMQQERVERFYVT